MEVVNTDVFVPTEHLIGQQQTTLSFGVSDAPALMAMLSTGLYTYPHRTMIQELLFNAWDAHKMSGATDTPIEVFINTTSGLIVRDYGPGIEPGENDLNIHGTYCIYGYSSKRRNKNLTGGFGLGTKAPFAYTESFSVTSFWGGTKNMYLVRRVSEDQDGRPGFTPLLKVPSTETGLMVVIPLKKGDEEKTRQVVRDIAYLSGLKINLQFEDEPVEEIVSYSVQPGEFLIGDDKNAEESHAHLPRHNKIYAIYGGVRYAIPRDDYYDTEYNFIYNVINDSQRLFIGFSPDSLTPTPNRENLNLNEKTKETIKQAFEIFYEKFQEIVEPLAKVYIQIAMTNIQKDTKDPILALYRALLIGTSHEELDLDTLLNGSTQFAPQNPTDQSIWLLGLRLINKHTQTYLTELKKTNWYKEITKAYVTLYPEGISYMTRLRMENKYWTQAIKALTTKTLFSKESVQTSFHKLFNHQTIRKFGSTIQKWNKSEKYPMVFRVKTLEGWRTCQFERPFHKANKHWDINGHKNKRGTRNHRPAKYDNLFYQFGSKDKNQFKQLDTDVFILPRVILMAKNVKSLESTRYEEFPKILGISENLMTTGDDRYYRYTGKFIRDSSILSVVVRSINGGYDKAKEYLKAQGYTVLEAPELEEFGKTIPKPKVKKPDGYRVLPLYPGDWVSKSTTAFKPEEMILDPEYYFYRTSYDLGEYSSKVSPPYDLLKEWMKAHPKTVVVNNSLLVKKLENSGVKNIETEFHRFFSTWFKDAKRFRSLVLIEYLESAFKLPLEMLDSPAIRKEFNISIPPDVKIESYREDIKRMNGIKNTSYPFLESLSQWVKLNSLFMAPDINFIREKNNQFMMFDLQRLGKKFEQIPSGEQEAFIKKVIKMSKSF